MNRINVLGLSGSGKSRFAARLATILDAKYIELDSMFWMEYWAQRSTVEFQALINNELNSSKNGWVVDGFYGSKQGERPWKEADTIIFLDVPLGVCIWRILSRGTVRIIGRKMLWGIVRETPVGLMRLVTQTTKARRGLRREFFEARTNPDFKEIDFYIFDSNRKADRWLEGL